MSTNNDLYQPENEAFRRQSQVIGRLLIAVLMTAGVLVWPNTGGWGWLGVHGQTVGDVLRVVAGFIPALIVYVAFRVYRRDQ